MYANEVQSDKIYAIRDIIVYSSYDDRIVYT